MTEKEGRLLETVLAHATPALGVEFSCDGSMVASASKDKTAKVFDTTAFEVIHTLRGHHERVNGLAFSPHSRTTLATASKDKTVRVWNVETGSVLRTMRGHRLEVNDVSFGPDGRTIASASTDETVMLWVTGTGELLAKLAGHAAPVMACCFSPPGRRLLASASEDYTVIIWNAATRRKLKALKGHRDAVTDVKFSPLDDRIILSASRDTTIIAWGIDNAQKLMIFEGHGDVVTGVAFSPDGWLMASTCADTTTRIWNLQSCRRVATLHGHKQSVSSCDFNPSGQSLATASWDGTVKIWDISEIPSAGRTPDGKVLPSELFASPAKGSATSSTASSPGVDGQPMAKRSEGTMTMARQLPTKPPGKARAASKKSPTTTATASKTTSRGIQSSSSSCTSTPTGTRASQQQQVQQKQQRRRSGRASTESTSSASSPTPAPLKPSHGSTKRKEQREQEEEGAKEEGTGGTEVPDKRVDVGAAEGVFASQTNQALWTRELDEKERLRQLSEDTKAALKAEHESKTKLAAKALAEEMEISRLRRVVQELRDRADDERIQKEAEIAELTRRLELLEQAQMESDDASERYASFWLTSPDAFTFGDMISSGSYCNVYTGTWEKSQVVLKQFSEKPRTAYYAKIWEKELETIALVRHPNIIQMFAASIRAGVHPVLAMEALAGSLKDLIALDSPLNCREACDIVSGTCSALSYLHARDIVHQRLAPDKVLLSCDMLPKVTGIGEAAAVKQTFADVPADILAVNATYNENLADLAADDVLALGKLALAACTLEPPNDRALSSQALKIQWEPIQALVAQCIKATRRDRPGASLLAQLMFEVTQPDAWEPYWNAADRRRIARMPHGLVFA